MVSHDCNLALGAAQRILRSLYITAPSQIDIEAIAFDLKVLVRERSLKNTSARLFCKGDIGIITIDASMREVGQKRFAIAHELGHFQLHRKKDNYKNFTDDTFFEWYKTSREEAEANAFAAEILMPTDIFSDYCKDPKPSFASIRNIAKVFNTSLTATTLRYVELGPHPCALVVSIDKVIRWFRVNKNFPYRLIDIGSNVPEISSAMDFFKNGLVSNEPEELLGDVWLSDRDTPQDLIIYEHIQPLPYYNTVLSLLWVYESK